MSAPRKVYVVTRVYSELEMQCVLVESNTIIKVDSDLMRMTGPICYTFAWKYKELFQGYIFYSLQRLAGR